MAFMEALASDVRNAHLTDLITNFDTVCRRVRDAVKATGGELLAVGEHWAQQAGALFPNYAVARLMDDDAPAAQKPKQPRRSFQRHPALPTELVAIVLFRQAPHSHMHRTSAQVCVWSL